MSNACVFSPGDVVWIPAFSLEKHIVQENKDLGSVRYPLSVGGITFTRDGIHDLWFTNRVDMFHCTDENYEKISAIWPNLEK